MIKVQHPIERERIKGLGRSLHTAKESQNTLHCQSCIQSIDIYSVIYMAYTHSTLVVPGRYRHYKGNEYQVIDQARHSETNESMVVYRPLYGEGDMWVRPSDMFAETVVVDGVEQPRFKRIELENEAN